jgi:hypothetical protein
MHRMANKTNLTMAFILLFCALTSHAQQSHIGHLVGNAKHGKALYQRYCIFCHGAQGDGNGDSAPYLDPKPRDFTKATFKCRSTPSGDLPLDSDLYDTITRGVHASRSNTNPVGASHLSRQRETRWSTIPEHELRVVPWKRRTRQRSVCGFADGYEGLSNSSFRPDQRHKIEMWRL